LVKYMDMVAEGAKYSSIGGVAGEAEGMSRSVTEATRSIEEWLGPGSKTIESETSDLILQSADGTRQIRFDITDPHGLEPHINIQTFTPRKLFPGDERMIEIGNIHIFPRP
jgi:hypothetical protein